MPNWPLLIKKRGFQLYGNPRGGSFRLKILQNKKIILRNGVHHWKPEQVLSH